MSQDLILPDDEHLGPMMKRCSEEQRRFVIALVESGSRNYTEAALAAGLTPHRKQAQTYGHRYAHNPRVQAAMHEEATKRLGAGAVLASSVLVEIIESRATEVKDRLKAIGMLMNRVGMAEKTEAHVVHEVIYSPQEQALRVKQLCDEMGLDVKQFLPQEVIDAEFREAPEPVDKLAEAAAAAELEAMMNG